MITNRTTKLPKRKQLFVLVLSVALVRTSLPHQEFGYLAGKRAMAERVNNTRTAGSSKTSDFFGGAATKPTMADTLRGFKSSPQ